MSDPQNRTAGSGCHGASCCASSIPVHDGEQSLVGDSISRKSPPLVNANYEAAAIPAERISDPAIEPSQCIPCKADHLSIDGDNTERLTSCRESEGREGTKPYSMKQLAELCQEAVRSGLAIRYGIPYESPNQELPICSILAEPNRQNFQPSVEHSCDKNLGRSAKSESLARTGAEPLRQRDDTHQRRPGELALEVAEFVKAFLFSRNV